MIIDALNVEEVVVNVHLDIEKYKSNYIPWVPLKLIIECLLSLYGDTRAKKTTWRLRLCLVSLPCLLTS